MALASGTADYTFETPRVLGHGHSLSNDELEAALSETAKIVFDDEGNARIKDLLTDLAGTEFKKHNLNAILEGSSRPENWRVGEALAEAYLVQHRDCTFPWPDGRDERKSGSCLPGADLAGFQKESDIDRFAFGEVKTSSEAAYPPGVMHGRHGLKKQIEDLRDQKSIRDDLVKYLAHRAHNASWQKRFRSAASLYLHDPDDVRVFGMLVRDVLPHPDDLRVRVETLSDGCPESMLIELLSLYLPLASIATLGSRVKTLRQGGRL